jgi:hypothetical protein
MKGIRQSGGRKGKLALGGAVLGVFILAYVWLAGAVTSEVQEAGEPMLPDVAVEVFQDQDLNEHTTSESSVTLHDVATSAGSAIMVVFSPLDCGVISQYMPDIRNVGTGVFGDEREVFGLALNTNRQELGTLLTAEELAFSVFVAPLRTEAPDLYEMMDIVETPFIALVDDRELRGVAPLGGDEEQIKDRMKQLREAVFR